MLSSEYPKISEISPTDNDVPSSNFWAFNILTSKRSAKTIDFKIFCVFSSLLAYSTDGDLWDYVFSGSGKSIVPKNKAVPFIAITTTSGTGTEADYGAVITDEEYADIYKKSFR